MEDDPFSDGSSGTGGGIDGGLPAGFGKYARRFASMLTKAFTQKGGRNSRSTRKRMRSPFTLQGGIARPAGFTPANSPSSASGRSMGTGQQSGRDSAAVMSDWPTSVHNAGSENAAAPLRSDTQLAAALAKAVSHGQRNL